MNRSSIRNKLPFLVNDPSTFLLVRDIVITTFIGGLSSFLQYIFNFITVNRLPKNSYGIFTAVLGLIYLIQIPALSLQTFFAKEVAENKRYANRKVLVSTIRRFTLYALLLMFVMILVTPLLSTLIEIPSYYLLLVSIIVFASIFTPVLKGYLLGFKKIGLFNVFTIIEAVLKLGILLFALNISLDPTGPILAYGIPMLLVGVAMLFIINREKKVTESVGKDIHPNVHWGYLGVTLATLFLYNSAFSLDVILLNPDARASYGSLVLLGKIVFFASIMASSVLFSYLVNSKNRKEKNRFLLIGVAINTAVSVAIIAVYFIFSDQIVGLMFGGAYKEITPYIVPLSIGVAVYAIAFLFINYLLSTGNKGQIVILFGTFLLQIILFRNRNDSLADAVTNQFIVYLAIAVSIIIFWYYSQRKEKSGE